MIVTRIPPSPTGMFHIGSLRTALYDYLLAKHEGGKFFLRIEDTDRERLVEGATENIVESLYWAHIPPDEGVMLDEKGSIAQIGHNGPYVQSERLDIYETYIQQLLDDGKAYYAFDTAEELEEMRNRQRLNKQPPRYDRLTMKNSFTLGEEEAKKRIRAGESYVVRMVVPENQTITFTDLIRGDISVESKEVDEQIIRKSDGFPTYHLAVVVDDNAMGATHVLRGDEWISSTPKHILLYQYFGWKQPVFGHLPVIVNETGKKLSKRHGDVSVFQFKDKGYLPEALVNFVALLGWNPGTEQEVFTLEELIKAFDINKVQKKPAFFDRTKLDWMNEQWIKKIPLEDLTNRCLPYLKEADLADDSTDSAWLQKLVNLQKDRLTVLSEIAENVAFIVNLPDYEADLLTWKKSTLEDAKAKLQEMQPILESINNWNTQTLNDTLIAWIKEKGSGVGDCLWPLRVSLSGQKNSPGPFDIADMLGKEETQKRIEAAIKKI